MTTHVIPTSDCRRHDWSTMCECRPVVVINERGDLLAKHSAFDGREALREAEFILYGRCVTDAPVEVVSWVDGEDDDM